MANVRPFPHDLPPHSARRLRYRRSSACLAGGQQFLQFCWLCARLKVGTKARIMALIYSSALVTAPLLRPRIGRVICMDLIFSVPRSQRGGGIEIFVNFAGGAGQVSPIATGGDGTEFVQRQLWVIGVEFLAELTDRLVKARRAGEAGRALPRSSIRSLRTTRAGRRQGPSAHLTTNCPLLHARRSFFAC